VRYALNADETVSDLLNFGLDFVHDPETGALVKVSEGNHEIRLKFRQKSQL